VGVRGRAAAAARPVPAGQGQLDLYQRGKDKQWDAAKRIDWSLEVDPNNVMATPDEINPIYGSRQYEALSQAGSCRA
jgi:hypothetical protein